MITPDYWPKAPTTWREGRTLCASIPFTWDLPGMFARLARADMMWDRAVVGGPAVKLMPGYFAALSHVSEGQDMPGVLQRANPFATRTTTGCPNRCGFCGIGRGLIEGGGLVELEDWPDLPILCDNNLLASSPEHFDRVMDRLEAHGWCDFNQGLDARLLTDHHAERMARVGKPVVRLALDHLRHADAWEDAFRKLMAAKVPKSRIRSYAIIGFDSAPGEAWERCAWIEAHGVKALPMWFHALDQLERNVVTARQEALGWHDIERRNIMQWYYQHKATHGGPPGMVRKTAALPLLEAANA